MHIQVFFRYGVRTEDDRNPTAFFKEGFECVDMGAGWITNHKAGSQVNNRCAIFHHLFAGIFDVYTRTAVSGGKANQLNAEARIDAERTVFVPHRSQTLPARAAAVAIADNFPDLFL